MSLIINDAHIDAVKEYVMTQCDTLDSITSRYVRAMEVLIENGIMEGATADALKEFLSAVESDLTDNSATPALMETQAERFCTNFIKKVDKADKQIY